MKGSHGNAAGTAQGAHRTPAGRISASRRQAWLAAPLVAVIVALAPGVAACGGGSPHAGSGSSRSPASHSPGSPGSSSPSGPAGSSAASGGLTAKMLEFAHCMRSHGVSGFGDPGAPGTPGRGSLANSGAPRMTYLGNGYNPNSPAVQAADRACRKYAVATPVTPATAVRVQAEQLKYAHCMRAHGVPGFPDPSPEGGFSIPNSVDENSPAFQAAERACKDLQPALPGPPGS
jgi:hypothetical protein